MVYDYILNNNLLPVTKNVLQTLFGFMMRYIIFPGFLLLEE